MREARCPSFYCKPRWIKAEGTSTGNSLAPNSSRNYGEYSSKMCLFEQHCTPGVAFLGYWFHGGIGSVCREHQSADCSASVMTRPPYNTWPVGPMSHCSGPSHAGAADADADAHLHRLVIDHQGPVGVAWRITAATSA